MPKDQRRRAEDGEESDVVATAVTFKDGQASPPREIRRRLIADMFGHEGTATGDCGLEWLSPRSERR
jgi:hypothetical protein